MSEVERIEHEEAWVLHARPWRETSGLLEVFTRNHGRLGLVVRGLRRPKSTWRALLQPFQRLRLSASGRGTLLTLRDAEGEGGAAGLHGDTLMAAFYLNELLLRLLHRGDAHPDLFEDYGLALHGLGAAGAADPVLRRFELCLLAGIGYGLNLEADAASGAVLEPAATYEYLIERGPVRVPGTHTPAGLQFSGAELLAIACADFAEPAATLAARRLLRPVLQHYLGERPLRTREVFSAMRRQDRGAEPPAVTPVPDAP